MTLKIERSAQRGLTIFVLSGRLAEEEIPELERVLGPRTFYSNVIIDLKNLSLVNRVAVKFLVRCQTDGLRVKNCPEYVRKWMLRERPG